ncbi:S41 family peptidase [Chitinophaga costaii]|nr:S41 family peptidase [Chitinophaga costaii]
MAGVLALGMYLGHKMPGSQNGNMGLFNRNQTPLQEVINLLKAKYVDTLQAADLQQEAIEGILSHLDPHSVYIPPANLADVNDNLEGNTQGIGVEINVIADTVNIVSVLTGSPADKMAVRSGDRIIKVNDSTVAGNGITVEGIRKLLRGPEESKVKVTVLRGQKLLDMQITRGIIPLYSVDAAYMTAPGVGYIKISKFSATTYKEFMDAITKLKGQGLKDLIIDLRQNPGGYLEAATNIADELLSDNKLILYSKGSNYPKAEYKCNKPGVFEDGPLAILTDEGSASASEILAGAIQDWDRGTVIGRRTFGKGLVQEQYGLSNGGALRLTIARYYIPSGRCIQKSYTNGRAAYDEDILNRYNHGELLNKDSIKPTDTVPYHTAKGRTVYGGGGITPDIFIPIDTSRFTPLVTKLYIRDVMNQFTARYYSAHLPEFANYHNAEDFNKRFQISDALFSELKAFAVADSVPGVQDIRESEAVVVKQRMKALFAKQLFRNEGYLLINNANDAMVHKAIEVLQHP